MAVSLERYRWSGVKHEREQNEREGIPSKNRDRSVSQSDRSPAASSSDTRAYSRERERERERVNLSHARWPAAKNRRNNIRNSLLNNAFNALPRSRKPVLARPPPLSTEIGPPADRELPETDVSFDTPAVMILDRSVYPRVDESRETGYSECQRNAGWVILEDASVTGASKLRYWESVNLLTFNFTSEHRLFAPHHFWSMIR